MRKDIFISICIPAYKNVAHLKRLLDSVAKQNFKDYEVIVTDDSADDSLKLLVHYYQNLLPSLTYTKNNAVLGSPKNWNAAISLAKGKWIKIMHDDDWFSSADSLALFAVAAKNNSKSAFLYSAYFNVFEQEKAKELIVISHFRQKWLKKNPVTLLSKNVIGPPSAVMFRNGKNLVFDNRMKWLVDIDFYIRYLQDAETFFIRKPLVNIGIHEGQVTKSAFRVLAVEISENFLLLEKVGIRQLKNIMIFDACWRLIRNLKIRTVRDIEQSGYSGEIHNLLISMIRWQSFFPNSILKIGLFSKLLMFIHYLIHRGSIIKM